MLNVAVPTNTATETILTRLRDLIQEGSAVAFGGDRSFVAAAPMTAWRTRTIAFLQRTLGPSDPYTQAFVKESEDTWFSSRDKGVAILANLRSDVESGYLTSYYLGVAGEVLADLIDLGSWSLGEGSKEAGAILIGSGLELGLRRLAVVHDVDISTARGIDSLNQALSRAGVYGQLRRGQVESWRILRNHAVHGEHEAYSDVDVRLMLDGVRTFLAEELR
jgi:hypothetical protein